MNTSRLLVGLLGLGVSVLCVGALVSLAATTLSGPYAGPTSVVVALLAVGVLTTSLVGVRGSGRPSATPYW